MQQPAQKNNVAKFLVLGTTDEVTACDCCGKSPLKMTYIVQLIDSPDVVNYYGSTCVTRNTQKTTKQIRNEIEEAEKARVAAACAEFQAHPAAIAHAAKIAEAMRLGIEPGTPFMSYHRAELLAANKVKGAIAEQYKVKVWNVR